MKSPVIKLARDLEKYRIASLDSEKRIQNLQKSNNSLVTENVNLENETNRLRDAINIMCEDCTMKASPTCESCPLHPSNILIDLWT